MKLTGVVLCQNAAETLDACLASLAFCDEVIVADDGSTDGSPKIAKKHNARIINLTPEESFAEKRNQTLNQIKEGWVLFLDADEVLEAKLADEIRRTIELTDSEGFFLQRVDFFLGKQLKHGEAGQMWLLRLARVERGKWVRMVHEIWNITGRTKKLDKGVILHKPHPTVESFLNSINRYTDLEMRERKERGKISISRIWIQLFIYPTAKFIFNFFIRLGLLDGTQGLIYAYCMSLHSLFVRIKILEKFHAYSA